MARIYKPEPSVNTAVEWALYRLSRFRDEREQSFRINQDSVASLERLGEVRAKKSLPVLRGLLRLPIAKVGLSSLDVPIEISEDQNLPLLAYLGKKGLLPQLIDHNWKLKLGLVTIKNEARLEFDGEAYLTELCATYSKKQNPLAHLDEEVGDQVLYQNLLDILDKLYDFVLTKTTAGGEGQVELGEKAKLALATLGRALRDMFKLFPFGNISNRLYYKQQIETAASMIEKNKPGSAETTILCLTERMEQDLERMEQARIAGQKKEATVKIKSDDELFKIGMKYYQIDLTKDGKITVPQRGFRKKGGVWIRELLFPKVPQESAARREQHKIDDIKKKIMINNDFIARLSERAIAMKKDSFDFFPVILDLACAFVEYKSGRLQIKRNTARRLNRALEKIKTAAVTEDEKARIRQIRFAISVMNVAVRELGRLNKTLERQLPFIVVKKRLLELVTDKRLRRDHRLGEFADKAVEMRQKPLSPGRVWQMVREANALRKEFKADDLTEVGIDAALKKIAKLSGYLAAIGRAISEKQRIGRAIADTRNALRIDIARVRAMKTTREKEMIDSLKRGSITRIRFILKSIKKQNETIAHFTYWAIREALLIKYYLANKAQMADSAKEAAYLKENHDALLEQLMQMSPVYLPVVSTERDKQDKNKTIEVVIGEALPADALRYKLKIGKAVS